MNEKGAIARGLAFIADVRQELDKVTWPSRKEIIITTIVVFVMAVMAALFFSVVDTAAYKLVHFIIGR
ncbi:MAG: preprotein translocase subunit SecE [Holosporales bacterium]|jgi:preprotein translocase subunit SecE|nr:preprotein translocase subunit SecE [Holosporales bacterium]